MKILALFFMLLTVLGTNANAATPNQRRGGMATTAASSGGTTSARSAVSARSAARTNTPAAAPAVAARSATAGRATVARGAAPAAQNSTVVSRAATKQKVIGTGTKVASATQNIVVSEECRQKYEGCMDSFCMLDNTSGGRCICSDRNAELNDILAQIEKLDQQSYQMATFGVEKIEMGDDAEQAIAKANSAAQSVIKKEEEKQKKSVRKSLDLSAWNTLVDFDTDDAFEETNTLQSMIDGKEGDALHRAAAQICSEQIPECAGDISMLQMMYTQKIRSDCNAYENSLNQQKNASAQKLAAAEQALREAALEQLHIANKYDLGQCTVEFKKCMITTGGCGEDFANCASVSAMDNTNTTKSSKSVKMYSIKGAVTTIDIYASTYDTLEAKKPLCMGITDSCVAVKDQVWNTFLREVAPQIKSAELIAEDKARQDCVGNISACFQKACKDTMDPNDPDGSYDMCLSRPGTMLNVCKMPLNACGINADSQEEAEQSEIWQFVIARLASMRVDSCTNEVKECLTSDDRCGEDYSQCVGLDTDTIIRMCPYEKLTGCVEKYGADRVKSNEVYDQLADMVQGIMLNIDNNMLTQCQNAANEAMIKVCGDTESCNNLAVDDNIGARSLQYKICQYDASNETPNYKSAACYATPETVTDAVLRDNIPIAGVLSGMIFWNSIDFDENGNLTSMTEYIKKTGLELSDPQQSRMRTELESLQTNIQSAIQTIEADPTVQFCMNGREIPSMHPSKNEEQSKNNSDETSDDSPKEVAASGRFPGLTRQMRQTIAISALQAAKDNYYKQYDKLSNQMLNDFQGIGQRMVELNKDDNLDVKREAGRVACYNLAHFWNLAKLDTPDISSSADTSSASSGIIQDTYIMPFTGKNNNLLSTEEKVEVASKKLKAESRISNLTLIQKTTTTYNWDTLTCQKCVSEQTCTKVKKPFLRSKYCASWTDEKTTCTDIQF